MKAPKIGDLTSKLSKIPQRLRHFITHDVRRNPILGLYLVIGVMVVGYAIYFVSVLYIDLTSDKEKRIASKPQVERVNTPPPTAKPLQHQETKKAPASAEKPAVQESPASTGPKTRKGGGPVATVDGNRLEISKWQSFAFEDGSRISFPPDWSREEIKPEKNILHGIRLQAPSTEASLKCYGRNRQNGGDIAKALKKTMARGGYSKIKEQKKKISNLKVVQLSGKLADKHMLVSIFDDQGGKYFIVSLVASEGDFRELQPYYTAVVDSYESATNSAVSISKIEEELEKSLEAEKEYLVGSTIRIKLKNGAKHKGVVVAENDDSLTLESYRFGGRYSFTVKKKDIKELVR